MVRRSEQRHQDARQQVLLQGDEKIGPGVCLHDDAVQ